MVVNFAKNSCVDLNKVGNCPLCGKESVVTMIKEPYYLFDCEECGKCIFPESTLYKMRYNEVDKNKLRSNLSKNKLEDRCVFVGTQKSYEEYLSKNPESTSMRIGFQNFGEHKRVEL